MGVGAVPARAPPHPLPAWSPPDPRRRRHAPPRLQGTMAAASKGQFVVSKVDQLVNWGELRACWAALGVLGTARLGAEVAPRRQGAHVVF